MGTALMNEVTECADFALQEFVEEHGAEAKRMLIGLNRARLELLAVLPETVPD